MAGSALRSPHECQGTEATTTCRIARYFLGVLDERLSVDLVAGWERSQRPGNPRSQRAVQRLVLLAQQLGPLKVEGGTIQRQVFVDAFADLKMADVSLDGIRNCARLASDFHAVDQVLEDTAGGDACRRAADFERDLGID